MFLLTRYQDQGQRTPFGNLFFLGSLKKKSSHLPALVHNCRNKPMGCGEEEGPGFGGSARSCGVPVPVCTGVQSLQQTPGPRRPELAGDQSLVLPFHGLTEAGSHLLSSSSPAGLDWRMLLLLVPMEMLKERAASSHPAQGAPQTPRCWHCRHAACSPKAPNTEGNSSPSPPGAQTPRGTGQGQTLPRDNLKCAAPAKLLHQNPL